MRTFAPRAREQIDLFSQAEFVIAPHGAALANLQFTPAGAKVIVLENEWNHTFMADMLTQSGHTAEVLVCKDHVNRAYEANYLNNGVTDFFKGRASFVSRIVHRILRRFHAVLFRIGFPADVDAEIRRCRDMIVDCDALVARVRAMCDRTS